MSGFGSLYILPGFLGEHSTADLLCGFEISLIQKLNLYFAENERTARRFLRKAGYDGDLNLIRIERLDKDTGIEIFQEYIQLIKTGKDAGMLSEAGMPALADPGTKLIQLAHQNQIKVIPVPGPSAILLAIVSSGLNGQLFSFNGYLPVSEYEKAARIRQLEELAYKNGYAQYFIETPYRNNQLLASLLKTCKNHTPISIAANLTEPEGWNRTLTVAEWKKQIPELHKIPVVFGIGK